MSLHPQFRNDLFISYRRAANETPDHWVDSFCESLRSSLTELVGNGVSIWRDADQIPAGSIWRDELTSAIDESAIFLALFSQSYLNAEECRKELDRFLKRMKDDTARPRAILPVFKQPLDPDETPPPSEIRALQRHDFFRWAPPGSPYWVEFKPGGDDVAGRNYWESLGRLAQDIKFSLKALKGAMASRGKVFVARVCPELEEQREQLRADLQQVGYLVVPRNEYMWNEADNEARIAEDLNGALLSVHLVSGARSCDPESAAHSRLQLVMANTAMKSAGHVQPLVWIQPSAAVDASARELLDTIRNDLANDGVEYRSGSFEVMKTLIYDKLPGGHRDEAAVPPPEPTITTPGDLPADGQDAAVDAREVALIVEESDVAEMGPLRALLAERLGYAHKPIKCIDAVPKDVERMKRILASCHRCVIFWAGQGEEWLDDLLDHRALAGRVGRETLCVYIAGPRTTDKAVFRTPKATIVDATTGDGEAALRSFLDA